MTMMCFLCTLNLKDQTYNFILLLITFYSWILFSIYITYSWQFWQLSYFCHVNKPPCCEYQFQRYTSTLIAWQHCHGITPVRKLHSPFEICYRTNIKLKALRYFWLLFLTDKLKVLTPKGWIATVRDVWLNLIWLLLLLPFYFISTYHFVERIQIENWVPRYFVLIPALAKGWCVIKRL